MTIQTSKTKDERKFNRYLAMRNAPRDTMVNGIHSNGHLALEQYDDLSVALVGGHEATEAEPYTIEDMSEYAVYHANTVAPIQPFISAMYGCMRVINQTMHVVDALAAATNMDLPFVIEPEEIDILAYITTLQGVAAALTATAQETQQIMSRLNNDNEKKTLDEQFVEWLKEHNAAIQYLCIGPKNGAVTIDNFITPTGTNIPPGWMITISLVEAKPQ